MGSSGSQDFNTWSLFSTFKGSGGNGIVSDTSRNMNEQR